MPTSGNSPLKFLPVTVQTICLRTSGGMELSSEEGTTQGCPLSMAMYALSKHCTFNRQMQECAIHGWFSQCSSNMVHRWLGGTWRFYYCNMDPRMGTSQNYQKNVPRTETRMPQLNNSKAQASRCLASPGCSDWGLGPQHLFPSICCQLHVERLADIASTQPTCSIDGHLFKEPCLPWGTTCNHWRTLLITRRYWSQTNRHSYTAMSFNDPVKHSKTHPATSIKRWPCGCGNVLYKINLPTRTPSTWLKHT